eukprot:1033979-Rhodomonas_salina.1
MTAHRPILEQSEGFRRARDLCFLDLDLVYERHNKGGSHSPLEKSKWDPMWKKAFSYNAFEGIDIAYPTGGFTCSHFRLVRQGFERGLERLEKAMACERLTAHQASSRASLGEGHRKEVKRHFD